MRICVCGSLTNVPRDKELCVQFVAALGREIADKGHTLLNGCRSSLDLEIAKAAHEWLSNHEGQAIERIISYCLKSDKPIHAFGRVRASALADWEMNHPELKVPEQISLADAVVLIAGSDGTFWARNWAFYARKTILGIPRFGGAGETIYEQELATLRTKAPVAASEEYETLNQLCSDNIGNYAKDVIRLAERLVTPRNIFTVMSFDNQDSDDIYESYGAVCSELGFEADRTDRSDSLDRIIPRIETGIRQSAIVIADVTGLSPNVMYEVGFAKALGKDLIITAKSGTKLPFDLSDIPTIFWSNQSELKQELRKRFGGLKQKYGR